jgi:hypothetical protein
MAWTSEPTPNKSPPSAARGAATKTGAPLALQARLRHAALNGAPNGSTARRAACTTQRRLTVLVWLAVLLPLFDSWLVVVAAAWLAKVPAVRPRTTQRMVALAPGSRAPSVQRGAASAMQPPWLLVTETKHGRLI